MVQDLQTPSLRRRRLYMKNENTWDSEGNYFNPDSYAEADVETIKQLVLPGMEAFEHIVGRLILTGEINAAEATDRLAELEGRE